MARPLKSAHKLSVTKTVRITQQTQARLDRAVEKMVKEEGDTHREALDIGLTFLEISDYDMVGALIDRAMRQVERQRRKGSA